MLVPTGLAERPHPINPLPFDVRPRGSGDAVSFQAEIDLVPGWEHDYRRWTRRWVSLTPDTLFITDEYELARGSGVDFYWNTRLPVEIGADSITISGMCGRVELTIPAGCIVGLEKLPIAGVDYQHRITFHRPAPAGTFEVRVRLISNNR
jgi:hypothetical protein